MARSTIVADRSVVTTMLILLSALLFSCVSADPYNADIPELDEATVVRLEQLLEQKENLQVLQDIDTLRRTRSLSGDLKSSLDELDTRALNNLTEDYLSSLKAKEYSRALTLRKSLLCLNQRVPGDLSEGDLLMSAAKKALAEDKTTVGLMRFFEASLVGEVGSEDILLFGEAALQQRNAAALKKIAGMLENLQLQVPDRYLPLINSTGTASSMLGGTVTIWVNRGIKLISGVGYPERVVGSGFFIDSRGYIITNYHVISSEVDPEYEGYSRLYVRPEDDPTVRIPARVVGWNSVFDIALLKTEIESDYTFFFEEEVIPEPGDKIYAIGSPAGLESTITSGIVSARDRELLQMGDVLQVDVPINSGNSGGPLVDEAGKLVGVVFAGIEQFEGVNFAIPSEWLTPLVPGLFQYGEYSLPWIGAMVVKADRGLEVMYLLPGSPAHRAGILPGDIITHVAGREVSLVRDVHKILLKYSPDTMIQLQWSSDQEEQTGYIQLLPRPTLPMEVAFERDTRENLLVPLFGMRVEKVDKNGLEQNYIVKRVYSGFSADELGISLDDPFSIRDWVVEEKEGYAAVQIRIKKRKAGFIESVIQIATYLEIANFI
ncbi:MAG: serine protease [Spirochaetales bacterium]|nr:serine protease [Spirochaetales bacterium]